MRDDFSHLTDNELDELIGRYKANEKNSVLVSDYKLNILPKQLYWRLPAEVLDENCSYCNSKLIRSIVSKTAQRWGETAKHCSKCGHTDKVYCHCGNCKKQRLEEKDMDEQSEQEIIANLLNNKEVDKSNFEDLTLTDKIYLGTLLLEGISEDYSYIKPLRRFINTLAPTDAFRSEIIDRLMAINAISIHSSTKPKCIQITDYNSGKYRFYTYKVKWALNVKSEEIDKFALIESLIKPKDMDKSQYHEALLLWKKIALYESIVYYKYSIKKFLGIDYKIEFKTKTILNDLTNNFSINQIYGIIHKSVMKSVKLHAKGGVSRKRASKNIVGYIQSFEEGAKINDWNLKKNFRLKDDRKSALSKYFFERVIKIGYQGFSEVPNINIIQSKLSASTEGITQ